MQSNIKVSPEFKREVKRFIKKYPSLQKEVETLLVELHKNALLGTPLGDGLYKIRVAVASKNSGKSGGMRVITYVVEIVETDEATLIDITLLTIYDKSEMPNISKTALLKLLKWLDLLD